MVDGGEVKWLGLAVKAVNEGERAEGRSGFRERGARDRERRENENEKKREGE